MSYRFTNIMNMSPQWITMPGKYNCSGAYSDIYEKTYEHWREMWVDILDSGKNTRSDNFIRQDLLCPLILENNVAGLIGCNFFNLDQKVSYDHSFISSFPKETFEEQCNGTIVMSIEYLSVAPQFRKKEIGYSLGDVLLGLSMKIFSESDAKFVLGTARKKINVDSMCYQFGFKQVGEIDRFGLYCAQILNSKESLKEHPDYEIREKINYLWDRRATEEIKEPRYQQNQARRAAA